MVKVAVKLWCSEKTPQHLHQMMGVELWASFPPCTVFLTCAK